MSGNNVIKSTVREALTYNKMTLSYVRETWMVFMVAPFATGNSVLALSRIFFPAGGAYFPEVFAGLAIKPVMRLPLPRKLLA